MKYLYLLLLLACVGFSGCKKESTCWTCILTYDKTGYPWPVSPKETCSNDSAAIFETGWYDDQTDNDSINGHYSHYHCSKK